MRSIHVHIYSLSGIYALYIRGVNTHTVCNAPHHKCNQSYKYRGSSSSQEITSHVKTLNVSGILSKKKNVSSSFYILYTEEMYLHWKKNEDWQDEGIRRVSMFLGESTHCSPLQAKQQLHMRLEKKENNKQGLDGFADLRYMEGHRKQLKNRRWVDPRRRATSPSASSRRRAPIHPPPPLHHHHLRRSMAGSDGEICTGTWKTTMNNRENEEKADEAAHLRRRRYPVARSGGEEVTRW